MSRASALIACIVLACMFGLNVWASNAGGGTNYNPGAVAITGGTASLSSAAISGTTTTNNLTITGTCIGCGGAGSTTFSGILAATSTSSINNSNLAQIWNWNGLTSQTGLSLTTTTETNGTLLGLNATTTGAGYALSSTLTGLSNTGYAGYFQNTATTGYAGYFAGPVNITGKLTSLQFFSTNCGSSTSCTILAGDMGEIVKHSSSSSVAVTLPQAGTSGFGTGVGFLEINLGTGAVTVTPTTSTVNGASSLVLAGCSSAPTCPWAYWVSDGTNWEAFRQ